MCVVCDAPAPNGVFSVDRDGAVHVEPTRAYAARHAEPMWATQSGPMLVSDGALHPAIVDDGPWRKIRNGVGARDAHTALFVISDTPVSCGRLARLFRDELRCRDAVFLDGAVSSVWIPSAQRRDGGHELGPIAVVLDRRRAPGPFARRVFRERRCRIVVAPPIACASDHRAMDVRDADWSLAGATGTIEDCFERDRGRPV